MSTKRGREQYEDESTSGPLSMDGSGADVHDTDIRLPKDTPAPDAVILRRQIAYAARQVTRNDHQPLSAQQERAHTVIPPDSFVREARYHVLPITTDKALAAGHGKPVAPSYYEVTMSLPINAKLDAHAVARIDAFGEGWSTGATDYDLFLPNSFRRVIHWTHYTLMGPRCGYTTSVQTVISEIHHVSNPEDARAMIDAAVARLGK